MYVEWKEIVIAFIRAMESRRGQCFETTTLNLLKIS